MPTFQGTFQADQSMTIRNYYAATITDCIDKILDSEMEEREGELEYVQLIEVKT